MPGDNAGGEWPVSSLRLETSTDGNGKVVMLDAQASYLNFAHIAVAEPWLTAEQRALLADFDAILVDFDRKNTV